MPITISNLPLEIIQRFNTMLLCDNGFDNLEKFEMILIYIEKELLKKSNYNKCWREKCEKQLKECKELYEKIKKKQETASRNKTQEPFYSIKISKKSYGTLYPRLKYKGCRFARKLRHNNTV